MDAPTLPVSAKKILEILLRSEWILFTLRPLMSSPQRPWKERSKPLRVRALVRTIRVDFPKKLFEAQTKTIKPGNLKSKDVRGVLEGEIGTACGQNIVLKLQRVHSMFHVSNLKKCLSDEPLEVSLDEIHVDDKPRFVEEPIEIMDREVKRLKKSCIPIIKVDGTPGEVLSLHGHVKISSERSIHNSSQKPHPQQMPHL
nr:reverse transcriptase domain-containing protein [Tanacetum cinerariifolium]